MKDDDVLAEEKRVEAQTNDEGSRYSVASTGLHETGRNSGFQPKNRYDCIRVSNF